MSNEDLICPKCKGKLGKFETDLINTGECDCARNTITKPSSGFIFDQNSLPLIYRDIPFGKFLAFILYSILFFPLCYIAELTWPMYIVVFIFILCLCNL